MVLLLFRAKNLFSRVYTRSVEIGLNVKDGDFSEHSLVDLICKSLWGLYLFKDGLCMNPLMVL